MTDAKHDVDFEMLQLGQHKVDEFAAAAGPTPSGGPISRLIFLHSSWRTSSTWFWTKFRLFPETLCYYEPFNDDLATITTEKVSWADSGGWDSRHPAADPYYREYLPLIEPAGGVRFFDPPISMDWFFPTGGLRGQLRESEIRYLSSLMHHAHQQGKVPVFGGPRSLGRVWVIKNTFAGFHIFLHRNLWAQWLSYLYYGRRSIPYFQETTARIVSGCADQFIATLAEFYLKRALSFRGDRDVDELSLLSRGGRFGLLRSLPESHAFAMFMALHIYLYLHAQLAADLTVDSTKLARDSEYRSRTESELARHTGLEISLSDIADERLLSRVAIGAATVDWDEIRENARAAVQALGVFADPTILMENATELIDSAIAEMRKSEAAPAIHDNAAEEIWFARLQEARCHWALGDDDAFVRQALALCNERPDRAEPLFDLARFHRERGMHEMAVHFAEAGLALEQPGDDAKFVENYVYQRGLQEELSISGFYCRDALRRQRGAAACNWLALNRDIPADTRDHARGNLRCYIVPTSKLMPSFAARPLGFSLPEDWRSCPPSVAHQGEDILVIQSAVPVTAGDHNTCGGQDGATPSRRHFLLRLNAALDVQASSEIPSPRDAQLFENTRLLACRDALWCSAIVAAHPPENRCQQVLARIEVSSDGECRFAEWRVRPREGTQRPTINSMPLVEDALPEGEGLRFVDLCSPIHLIDEAGGAIAETTPPVAVEQFRGGTQAIPFRGGWLALIHEEVPSDVADDRVYHHRFIWFDKSCALRGVSRPFWLHETGVEVAAGFAWHPNGRRLIISYEGDGKAWVATVDPADICATLEDANRLPSGAVQQTSGQTLDVPALFASETKPPVLESEKLRANDGAIATNDSAAQNGLQPISALQTRLDIYPRVLVAILAKQKEQALPLYLRCIEALDYPKSSIVLYVRTNNNTDRTEEILRDWMARVGSSYAGVDFDATPVPEPVETFGQHEWNPTRFRVLGNIRNTSLAKVAEHGCDFYFVCDVDNFIRRNTLRELVALKLPVVAPLLRVTEPNSYYSNYFSEVDVNGYYSHCDQYEWILQRRVRGVFEVPVVHCTYLIGKDVIPQLRYVDDSNRYEFVVFSDSARKAGIPQYIDNRQVYGYITFDAESEAAKGIVGDKRHDQIATVEAKLAAEDRPTTHEPDALAELERLPTLSGGDAAGFAFAFAAPTALPIHVINLDRTPARFTEFQRRNAHLCDFTRFAAVDGRKLDREKLIAEGIITEDCSYSAGNLGCALSHFALWRKAVEEDRPITIAEDDVIFSHRFVARSAEFLRRLPEDWDFVQWGWVFKHYLWADAIPQVLAVTMTFFQDQLRQNIEDFQSSDVVPTPIRLRHSFGTVCYSVSPKGARALLDHCVPLTGKLVEFPGFGVIINNEGIDCTMNGAYRYLKAFVSIPPLAVTEHREEETTTRDADAGPLRVDLLSQASGAVVESDSPISANARTLDPGVAHTTGGSPAPSQGCSDGDRKLRILIYTQTNWAFGAVHSSLAAHLRAAGWIADIKDWSKQYYLSEFQSEVEQYDYVLTVASGGNATLVHSYGIPREKIVIVAHDEWDVQQMIAAEGIDDFDRYAAYGVISDTLACSSIVLGVKRVPFVVRYGVEWSKYRRELATRLSSVGYATVMERHTVSGVERKRGAIAKACAEAAGLRFVEVNDRPFEEMPDFYAEVDSVVMPSLQEGAGLPPLEAAAAGRLVIGTPAGHFPRLAYEGLGILAPLEAGAFQRFTTETLIYYRDHPSAYVAKCAAIQEAAKQRDWQYIVKDWIELFNTAR